MKEQTNPQLEARRREVVNLAHKGWTQMAIASHLKIPQCTVSRDLAAMREFWRDFPVYDFEKVRFEQLQKIDLIEAEAWATWHRSQQKKISASLTRGKNGEQSRTSSHEQFGDPRYLREVGRCVAQRSEMIGVQPPTVPPERIKLEIPECNIKELFQWYLILCDMFGDPPYKPVGGLKVEHYAALVADYQRDPFQHDRWTKETEPEKSPAEKSAQGSADEPGQLNVSPENLPAADSSAMGRDIG